VKAKFITESEIFKGKSEEDLYNDLKDINPLYAKIVSYISTHYTNWSPQVSTTVENFFFRFDPREWPISFNYMGYRIHYEQHNGKVVLGIANDKGRYDYYIIKDFNDFINLMRNKGGRPAIEPARKNIRKVKESIGDLLKGKTEEEIEKNLDEHPDYKIVGPLSHPTEHLEQAVQHKNLQGVFDSLKRGASYSSAVSWSSSVTTDESLLLFLSKNGQHLLLANDGVLDLPKELTNVLLKRASQNGFTDLAKWALDKGADINYQDRNGSTPIYYAAKHGYLETVKFLLDNGADMELENKEGYTALFASLSPNQVGHNANFINPEMVWFLVDKGADINHKLKNGASIFTFLKGKLLDEFLNKTDIKPSESEMIYIIHRGSIKNIKNLVDKGYLDLNKPISWKYQSWDNKPNKPLLPIEHILFSDNTGPGKMKFMLQYGSPFPSNIIIKKLRNELRNSRYSYGPDDKWHKLITQFIESGQISESVGDVLKPKDKKQIAEELAQQMYLDLLENKALSFFEPLFHEGPHKITQAWDTIDYSFNQYNKKVGPGLYVMSILVKEQGINPLQNLYPVKQVLKQSGVIVYDLPRTELETAIKVLIAQTMVGIFGNGFHIKYFDPINESVFQPKHRDDIVDNIVDNILQNYSDHTMHFHKNEWRQPPFKLVHHSGDGFMNHLFKKYGVKGTYVHVGGGSDEETNDAFNKLKKYLYNLNAKHTSIGLHTIIVRDNELERKILSKLCREVYNEEIPALMIRKFI